VQICGVQCPALGRRGAPDSEAEAVPPQPFATEAKHFTESSVLNREVRVVLQGVDKHDNLIASVLYSSGAEQGAQPVDLGLQLVEQGLGRVSTD